MVANHSEMRCVTVASSGAELQWTVTVDGQVSALHPQHRPLQSEVVGERVRNASTLGGDL